MKISSFWKKKNLNELVNFFAKANDKVASRSLFVLGSFTAGES